MFIAVADPAIEGCIERPAIVTERRRDRAEPRDMRAVDTRRIEALRQGAGGRRQRACLVGASTVMAPRS